MFAEHAVQDNGFVYARPLAVLTRLGCAHVSTRAATFAA